MDTTDDLGPLDDDDGFRAKAASSPPPLLQNAAWMVATLKAAPPPVPPNPAVVPVCPSFIADGWQMHGDSMFRNGTPGLAAQETQPGQLPQALARYCLYSWVGVPGAHALPAVPGPDVLHMGMDSPVVVSNSNGLEEAYRNELADVFLSQAGRINAWSPKGTHAVTVAVVDSESQMVGEPMVEHATAMVDIIDELACGGSGGESCAIQTYRSLAMPLMHDGTEREGGGYYGTRAHVAAGIVEAVLAWRKQAEEGEDSRLVINLSLGWVAEGDALCGAGESQPYCPNTPHVQGLLDWIDGPPNPANPTGPEAYPTRPGAEAVHTALLYASCNGAMVVAAAGNSREGSCNDVAVAPAAWSYLSAPTATECAALDFFPPQGVSGTNTDPRPLVLPVSAVDHNDAPIHLTRPNSQTRIVAPGYMATTGEDMMPLTGTSISAAVTSAAIARLWASYPEWDAAAVVERLYETGSSVGRNAQADEHAVVAASPARRLSLCRALDMECSTQDECAYSSWCVPEESVSSHVLNLHGQAINTSNGMTTTAGAATTLTQDTCTRCGGTVNVWIPDATAQPHHLFSGCGWSQSNYIVENDGPPLAGPQPDTPLCPDCPIISNFAPGGSKAILSLDSVYTGATVVGATV
ncbi:MAG: S8/S53 family peptidase, partial [Deltaproteobacteria bacterium]|nr:S8/S53 family peptidase [Deltaproteobacteria bacterium]